MKFCLCSGQINPATDTSTPPEGALHPGYFFPDAAAEERLHLNTVLTRLGAALDAEEQDPGNAPDPAPHVSALAELAAATMLCFATPAGAALDPPVIDDDSLVPLDRDSLVHSLAQCGPLTRQSTAPLSPTALRLARALAGLAAPTAALHWLLLHRLLPALVDPATLEGLRAARAPIFAALKGGPAIPLEFAVALSLAARVPTPAARLLSLTYWLNVPTAQGVLISLRHADSAAATGLPIVTGLDRADLNRGLAGQVVVEHALHKRTPLWYYLKRERDMIGRDGRLGPLGARLLAEGMLGIASVCGSGAEAAFAREAESPPPDGIADIFPPA